MSRKRLKSTSIGLDWCRVQKELVKEGHKVLVEANAGAGMGAQI